MRPACRRCVTTGRTCDGYGVWGPGDGGKRLMSTQAPAISYNHTRAAVSGLPDSDKRHYEWFVHRTIYKLVGIFDSPFWETLILQMSSSEPAVLHAVLTVSSVHKSETANIQLSEGAPAVAGMQDYCALRHYNRSIGLLQGHLSSDNPTSTRIALVCCLLFVSLEYLQKRYETGYLHLSNGVRLLELIAPGSSCKGDSDATGGDKSTDLATEWLADAVWRLYIQARMLKSSPSRGVPKEAPGLGDLSRAPNSFQSLNQARHELERLLSTAYSLQERGHRYGLEDDLPNAFELLIVQPRLRNDLATWLQSFREFKVKNRASLSTRERLAYRLLLVYQTMAYIITETSLTTDNECVFDSYENHFTSITSSSAKILFEAIPVVLADVSNGACQHSSSYVADMGLVPPLYYCALKCRMPYIRRKAVHILSQDLHQEGIWHAPLAAKIASEITRLEEVGFYDDLTDGPTSRLRVLRNQCRCQETAEFVT
ncbi:hypothetical protein CCHL11_07921 [Colletotrichum chlorophyti]|uniref:Zn(2)-C6 fungal-type domain-containing protein n=1 Tax=Colletotrichum chlorophyti TaxID=708187 RepID=A0A1Q8S8M5_9PEZI|nr:hypothetical protein CCHL11_07921 [Colletotrichum chlorophyti]